MAKKRTRADRLKAIESDITRAISGGSDQDVARAVKLVQEAGIETPLLPEVTALREEQAAAAAETKAMEAETASQIALQESIRGNVPSLARGDIAGIDQSGAIDLTPERQFERAQEMSQRTDAFQTIVNAFKTYGIEGMADTVFALMADPTIGENQAIYKLKYDTSINPTTNKPWNEAYSKRFAANFERIKAGKPALSEGEYLTAERSYARALQGLGVSRLATRANFDKFISGDVSVDEVVDRVTLAVERVQNATGEVKDALSRFYPNLSALDIAEAVLDPEVTLPALRRQIAAGEIAGGAAMAGLTVGGFGAKQTAEQRARAEELARYGVTEQAAREGFQAIADIAPRGGQLAAIYKESPYTQQTAEAEVFGTAGAVEARRKRERLTALERSSFAGSSGVSGGALARDRAGAI